MGVTIRIDFLRFNGTRINGTRIVDSLRNTMNAVLQTLSMLGRETARIVLHASCVACDGALPWRDRVGSCCRSCWEALPAISGAKCQSCALPWSGQDPGYVCGACLEDPIPVEWTEAWGAYRGALERVLHSFKFG
ncbi:MAG: double zinc ribbon domain-containing protein, partial [Thermoanaerobaculia bacterium]